MKILLRSASPSVSEASVTGLTSCLAELGLALGMGILVVKTPPSRGKPLKGGGLQEALLMFINININQFCLLLSCII